MVPLPLLILSGRLGARVLHVAGAGGSDAAFLVTVCGFLVSVKFLSTTADASRVLIKSETSSSTSARGVRQYVNELYSLAPGRQLA